MTGLRKIFVLCAALIGVCALAWEFSGLAGAQAEAPFQTTPGGLQYRDLQAGSGPAAAAGDIVEIHFVGWLDDNGARGRQIYNSRKQGRPVSFVVGTDLVMEAWNQGVVGMRPGGRRLLMVPPGLAYGDRAVDEVIPAKAHLIMIIELQAVEPAAD